MRKSGPAHRYNKKSDYGKLTHRTITLDERDWEKLSKEASKRKQSASSLIREIVGSWVQFHCKDSTKKKVAPSVLDGDEEVDVQDLLG